MTFYRKFKICKTGHYQINENKILKSIFTNFFTINGEKYPFHIKFEPFT